ncbi:MAG TPA: prepilin peptidase [Methylomirabilota bacterium]|nr:prepilin peptidase [Methylomirabilota bacterium]
MDVFYLVFLFLFGICVGSFLNVVTDRLPNGESIIKGRSHCDFCKKKLGFFDLIPLFSYVFLAGRCRYCQKKLSFYYPLVELLTGLLFIFIALHTGMLSETFYYLFIVSTLIILFFTDLKYGILPFVVIFPTIIISLGYILLTTQSLLLNDLLSAFGAFLFFLLLFFITKGRGMGFGDVVYVFLMGLLLGFPNIVLGLYIAFLSGAIISLILVLIKRKKLQGGTVPFGPFLVAGTFISLFWGQQILLVIWHLTISH